MNVMHRDRVIINDSDCRTMAELCISGEL
jgi:hypothetical protein